MSPFRAIHSAVSSDRKGPPPGGPRPAKSSARSLDSHLRAEGRRHPARRVSSSTSHHRASSLDMEDRRRVPRRTDAIVKPVKSNTFPGAQMAFKRKKKGETMSMLLESGFFPIEEIIYGRAKRYNKENALANIRINLPPRLSFSEADLPPTPGSVVATPTEFYMRPPASPVSRNRKQMSRPGRRSALSGVSERNVKLNSGASRKDSDQISPSRLTSITKDSTVSENSPPPSGVVTPVATQIHLPGGSVLTVTPPELTAWKATVYLHGPIRLPTPAIMPRKNSIASLEAFQEAIDHVYQDALIVPRRRSDDAVVDDICDFFDDFGFEFVSIPGDKLAVPELCIDEVDGWDESNERYSTPPPEQLTASPVEVIIAKEVMETSSRPLSEPKPLMMEVVVPPVEDEETLRAKGIARLSRISAGSTLADAPPARRVSVAADKPRGSIGSLTLLPTPEDSMLDATLQHSPRNEGDGDRGKRADSQEVEEMDADSMWVAPGVAPKKGGQATHHHPQARPGVAL